MKPVNEDIPSLPFLICAVGSGYQPFYWLRRYAPPTGTQVPPEHWRQYAYKATALTLAPILTKRPAKAIRHKRAKGSKKFATTKKSA